MKNKPFKQFFARIHKFLAVVGIFLVFVSILPTTTVFADGNATRLGDFLPACQATSTEVPSLLACISQITYQVLLLGVVTFFARSTYLAIISIGSGNAVKYVMESVESLFVGIILVGLPIVIMGVINPLSERLSIGFIQELNMGPNAKLVEIDPNTDLPGCVGFYQCIVKCSIETQVRRENCIQSCKDRNTRSYGCSEECVGYVNDLGRIEKANVKKFQECLNPRGPLPPPTSTGEPHSSNNSSSQGSSIPPEHSGNSPNSPNPNVKGECRGFDQCMANVGAGRFKTSPYSCNDGNGTCMRSIASCIQQNANACDCAKEEDFEFKSDFSNRDENGSIVRKAFKGPTDVANFIRCMENR